MPLCFATDIVLLAGVRFRGHILFLWRIPPRKDKITAVESNPMLTAHFKNNRATIINTAYANGTPLNNKRTSFFLRSSYHCDIILGSLHPSIQDSDGKPKRDPKTILQILTDLLAATQQYQVRRIIQLADCYGTARYCVSLRRGDDHYA